MHLTVCPACSRHHDTREARCPFCAAAASSLSATRVAVPILAAVAFSIAAGCTYAAAPYDPSDGGTDGSADAEDDRTGSDVAVGDGTVSQPD